MTRITQEEKMEAVRSVCAVELGQEPGYTDAVLDACEQIEREETQDVPQDKYMEDLATFVLAIVELETEG